MWTVLTKNNSLFVWGKNHHPIRFHSIFDSKQKATMTSCTPHYSLSTLKSWYKIFPLCTRYCAHSNGSLSHNFLPETQNYQLQTWISLKPEASLELCGRKPAVNTTWASLLSASDIPSCLSQVIGMEWHTRNLPEWLIMEVYSMQKINLNTLK